MASTLKTPGVYVEEISKFPPSVAQVETAIPAFIGYTEFAEKDNESLTGVPTRITSLLEYTTYFGKAEKETGFTATVNEDDNGNKTIVTNSDTVTTSKFLMYYAMQMYFANGGGPCWIISVKNYKESNGSHNKPVLGDLEDGLEKLSKEDEPTLIVFPDAKSLESVSEFYGIYNQALAQCTDLQDRFTLIDTYSDDAEHEMTHLDGLRTKISAEAEEKKYGAAYFPYLKTVLNYRINESTVGITHTVGNAAAIIQQSKDTINATLASIITLEAETGTYKTKIDDAVDALADITTGTALEKNAKAIALIPSIVTSIDSAISHIQNVITQAEKVVSEARLAANASTSPSDTLTKATDLDKKITLKLRQEIVDFEEIKDLIRGATTKVNIAAEATKAKTGINDFITTDNVITTNIITPINGAGNLLAKVDILTAGPSAIGTLEGSNLAAIKNTDTEIYNAIKRELNKVKVVLPPSSSMAGVYARVDSSRGVWKAPANVSLKYVIKPTQKITHEQNGRLNIDTSGKTINAIRSFIGKGTIVWGARTLAGNDNEWRYISVRRFFNMVEESVKKASDQFVFEANDANTWVKIRAMIENFLTNQWRAGALAGAKADDAFYVRIGLNQTMTGQDILNGIMNIEIGMAVVRPAEFIVLKFSHKMQES